MTNMLKMATAQQIGVLFAQGWSRRRIARELGLDRETVSRRLREAPTDSKPAKAPTGFQAGARTELSAQSDQHEASLQGQPGLVAARPDDPARIEVSPAEPVIGAGSRSDCANWRETILALVEQGLSAQRIFQDLQAEHGYCGSYYSVRRFVARLGAVRPLPFRRMECEPGHELQVDFGKGAPVVGSDGRRRHTHLFRAVLSFSRRAYSEVSFRQTTEDFIHCIENAFWYFGGTPRVLVLDNLRAAVKHPDWFDPELVPRLQAFAEHYGIAVLPTRPRTPRHKGKVERVVDYAQENALKKRSFPSLEAQNEHLLKWEATIADTRIHGTTRQHVGRQFRDFEQQALKALPLERFPFFHEGQRTVHHDGHIEVGKAYYSMPPEYLGHKVWVRWDSRMVRVFNHRFQQIAVHARREPGRFSTHDQHVAPEKISGVELKVEELLRRASCCIGDHASQWAEAMIVARGIQGTRVLLGLLSLGKQYPREAVNEACRIAQTYGEFRLRALRQIVKAKATTTQTTFAFLDDHPLIRPLSDYAAVVSAALQRDQDREKGFLRHDRANECTVREPVEPAPSSPTKKAPATMGDRWSHADIRPPRSGYPSSGCSPAEPESVSPDPSSIAHVDPLTPGDLP